jgi:tetratricopeptide (TPR) repeat protein
VAERGRRDLEALVGRSVETERVSRLVADAVDGRSGALLVSGEAGVGKTSLVRYVAGEVGGGVRAVWLTCLPLQSAAVPFLPLAAAWRDAAAPLVGSPTRPGWLSERSTVVSVSLAFDAWVSELCADQPVLLVVDDLQWADQSTLDVLMYVLAGPLRRRLAVVVTIREAETAQPLDVRRWLAAVRRLPRVQEWHLARFDRATTAQFLGRVLGSPPHDSLVDEVFVRSLGNAYLTQLLVRGLPPDAARLPPTHPDQLQDAVGRIWLDLSGDARRLTQLVAVAARPQHVRELREMAVELDLDLDVPAALREAGQRGVLVLGDDDRYWFAHPLLAEVLERRLLPEDRRAWHAACAVTLARLIDRSPTRDAADEVALSDHYLKAGDLDRSLGSALRGAEAAESVGGAVEALRLLRRALELHRVAGGHVGERDDLLRRLRAAAERTGEQEVELDAVDELVGLLDPSTHPLETAALLVRRMRLRMMTGREFASLEDVGTAVRLAGVQPDSGEYALSMAGLACAEIWHQVPSGAARAARAVELARVSGSAAALSYALTAKVMAWRLGSPEAPYDGDPFADGLEAQAAAVAATDHYALTHASIWTANVRDGMISRTWIELSRGSRKQLTALGAPHAYVAWLATAEAEGLLFLGEWQACERLLRLVLGSRPGTGNDTGSRLVAARLAAWQGRLSEAEGHLARAEELFAEHSGYLTFGFDALRADLATARGDAEQAFEVALSGLDQNAIFVERLLPAAARAAADQAQALRDQGDDDEPALQRLQGLQREHPTVPMDSNPGPSDRAVAQAMQALYVAEVSRGLREPTALTAWSDAVDACAQAGLAWDEAYARYRVAEVGLRTRNHREVATVQLRRAHALATALGAVPVLDAVQTLAQRAAVSLDSEPLSSAIGRRTGRR